MKPKIFIDGAEGTTGLQIHERLKDRDDIELLYIDERRRKDPYERLFMICRSDLSILCLPDKAVRDIVKMVPGQTKLIDTSTAHRTDPGWTYGLPEVFPSQRQLIRHSNRVSNPGCHATGAILLLRPLVSEGIISPEQRISVVSITGYSGGGKKMIASYEDPERRSIDPDLLMSPGQYGLDQNHKHIPEIMKMSGITSQPFFIPVVADYFCGMQVMVPLDRDDLNLAELYRRYYANEPLIEISDDDDVNGVIYSSRLCGTDRLEISIHGNPKQQVLTATYDNLGKGASGAAIQNMEIMLGLDQQEGNNNEYN